MRRAHVLLAAICVAVAAVVLLRMRYPRESASPDAQAEAGPIDEARFWSLIEPLRSLPLAWREPHLAGVLADLADDEVLAFAAEYEKAKVRAYTWELWGAGYVVMQGCSDDGFKEFRNWLISEGRATFEAVLAEPDRLAELATIPVSPEPELGDWPMLPELDLIVLGRLGAFDSPDPMDDARLVEISRSFPPIPSQPAGTAWEESDAVLSTRYPRLWKLYGPNGTRRRKG
jgi:hypothetical protein